jgi:hypothetical protein
LKETGTENFGGATVTAGGLVFIGSTMDAMFHVFDKTTGEKLWEYKLPAAGYAAPMTYSVGGRQYVVIACGGGGKPGSPTGDAYVAFALPSTRNRSLMARPMARNNKRRIPYDFAGSDEAVGDVGHGAEPQGLRASRRQFKLVRRQFRQPLQAPETDQG